MEKAKWFLAQQRLELMLCKRQEQSIANRKDDLFFFQDCRISKVRETFRPDLCFPLR